MPPFFRFPDQSPVYISSRLIRATCHSHLIVLNLFTRMIFSDQYRSWSSSICSLLHSSVTLLIFAPNTLLSRLCFNTVSLFFLHRERPSFTPVHNNRQNYIATYFLIFVFLKGEREDKKILDRMVAGIPGVPSALNFSVSTMASLTLEHGAMSRFTVVVAIRVISWEKSV